MTLHLPPGAPRGTSVRLDDVDLGAAGVDIPLPTEVGHHEIVVQSPGHEPARTEVDLVEGQSYEILCTSATSRPRRRPRPCSRPRRPPRPAASGPMRVASYATMGLGVVGARRGHLLRGQGDRRQEPAGLHGQRLHRRRRHGPQRRDHRRQRLDGAVHRRRCGRRGRRCSGGCLAPRRRRPPHGTGLPPPVRARSGWPRASPSGEGEARAGPHSTSPSRRASSRSLSLTTWKRLRRRAASRASPSSSSGASPSERTLASSFHERSRSTRKHEQRPVLLLERVAELLQARPPGGPQEGGGLGPHLLHDLLEEGARAIHLAAAPAGLVTEARPRRVSRDRVRPGSRRGLPRAPRQPRPHRLGHQGEHLLGLGVAALERSEEPEDLRPVGADQRRGGAGVIALLAALFQVQLDAGARLGIHKSNSTLGRASMQRCASELGVPFRAHGYGPAAELPASPRGFPAPCHPPVAPTGRTTGGTPSRRQRSPCTARRRSAASHRRGTAGVDDEVARGQAGRWTCREPQHRVW